jgi:hypothetical protein
VRALLAALNTSIDTEPKSGSPPSSGLNPDPGSCGGPYEASGRGTLTDTGETYVWGGGELAVWRMDAVVVAERIVSFSEPGVMGVAPSFAGAHTDGWVDFCVSWDFSGANEPLGFGPIAAPTIGAAAVPSLWLSPSVAGSRNTEMRHGTGTGYFAVYFGFAIGASVADDVFWHVKGAWPT